MPTLSGTDLHERNLKTPLLTNISCTEIYKLLIMVTSAPESITRRNNIRGTWASKWHRISYLPKWKTMFQIGQSPRGSIRRKVENEFLEYNDIILGNFTDTFYNLPIKVMMAFEWAFHFCHFEYLLKSDDDVIIKVPHVYEFLYRDDINTKKRLYAGNVHYKSPRHLDPAWGKYQVTVEDYADEFYPNFTSGGGMIFSREVIGEMIEAHNTSHWFKLDDVYIGILAEKIGVIPTHDRGFNLFQQREDCTCGQYDIVRHGATDLKCMSLLYNC